MSYRFWEDAQKAGRKLWEGGDKAVQEADKVYVAVRDAWSWDVVFAGIGLLVILGVLGALAEWDSNRPLKK